MYRTIGDLQVVKYIEENFVVCSLFILAFSLLYLNKRPRKFPPGPTGFPLVGVAPYLGGRPEFTFMKWRKTYGDLIGCKLGVNLVVVLNNYDLIREAHVINAKIFSNRPDNFIMTEVLHKNGLTMTDFTESYVKERKFASASLSRLGMGKSEVENIIKDECECFINHIKENGGEINQCFKKVLLHAFGNTVSQICLGKRYEYGDPEFETLKNSVHSFFDGGALAYQMTSFMPWIHHIPPVRQSANVIRRAFIVIDRFLEEKIEEHEEILDPNNIRDFMDEFLLARKIHGDPERNLFTKKQLSGMVRDLYGGGMDTGHCTILWALILLANRPKVQERMYREISDNAGEDGILKFALKDKLPFCMSTIRECMRYRTLVPFGIAHATSDNIVFKGYHIPKGTTILPNIYAVHNDPEYWENPEQFIADRHLNADGRLENSKYFIPFGLGPRSCVGKKIADVEVFVCLLSIVQKFKITPIPSAECERPHVCEKKELTGLVLGPPENIPITLQER